MDASTEDPRLQVSEAQRNDEIRARLRKLREVRAEIHDAQGVIENKKAVLKLMNMQVEGLQHELVRLGDLDDRLDGMQTMLF